MLKEIGTDSRIEYELESKDDIKEANKQIEFHKKCIRLANIEIDDAMMKGDSETAELWEDDKKFNRIHIRELLKAIKRFKNQEAK